jgi:two-component system, OmpR family, sensor kinase
LTPSSDPAATVPPARSPWLAPLLVFALALLVTALLLASAMRSITAKDQDAFESEVTRTTDAVRERVDTTVTLLRGATGLFAGSEAVDRKEFRAYVGQLRLRERYPGILGIGYTERIRPEEMQQRGAEIRAGGAPQFRVWPEGPREEYHAVVYLEPLDERNAAAIGYDMYTDPTRREAMARARDEATAAASGRVMLVQEIDTRKQAGFLVYVPLFRSGTMPTTVEDRRLLLQGFVYSPLRVGDLLEGVRGSGVRMVDYELYDGPEAVPQALLRSTRETPGGPAAFVTERRLDVGGRTWLLRFSSRPEFEALSQRGLVPWLAAVSLASAALLAWITLVQARARREAEAASAQRRRNELALQASQERERERAERLQQLYAELREGERRKDEFLAVLAHELRNPLAPVRSSLEILKRVPEGPKAQRAREIAERQVAQMVRLIDDLLDVSRISRGKIALQRARTRLAPVIDAAVETSMPLIQARRHELVRGPVDPDLELDLDAARVAQIFTNLLNNAAHYTPEGGRIEIAVTASDEEVRVAVRDNGIGIEAVKLRQVFELFVQAQRSSAGGGLGIGLSLAARLAELHGGHIEASSEGPGRGSEFVVVLPRRHDEAVRADAEHSTEAPAGEDLGLH